MGFAGRSSDGAMVEWVRPSRPEPGEPRSILWRLEKDGRSIDFRVDESGFLPHVITPPTLVVFTFPAAFTADLRSIAIEGVMFATKAHFGARRTMEYAEIRVR